MNRPFGLSAAALALTAAWAMPAHAGLELQSAQDFGGSGLGAVNTVLTLQGKGNASFESGSVSRLADGAADLLQGDVKTGASQTQTRSLESLGIQSAADLRVVFNAVEPGNQGAWHRIQHYLLRHMLPHQELAYALRPSSASPAAGYMALHAEQQKAVIEAALAPAA